MNKYKNILLVDDNEDDQDLFRHMIADIISDNHFVVADSGPKGLKMLTKFPEAFDLIFLDLNMPGMDGFEFLRQLKHSKAYSDYKEIPVVTLSTFINEPEKCYDLGACVSILKPNSIRSFRAILRSLLQYDIGRDFEELRRKFL